MDFKRNSGIALYYIGGHQKTPTSREMVQKVKKRLELSPRRSDNQMAKELKISDRSIRHILKYDLKVKPY